MSTRSNFRTNAGQAISIAMAIVIIPTAVSRRRGSIGLLYPEHGKRRKGPNLSIHPSLWWMGSIELLDSWTLNNRILQQGYCDAFRLGNKLLGADGLYMYEGVLAPPWDASPLLPWHRLKEQHKENPIGFMTCVPPRNMAFQRRLLTLWYARLKVNTTFLKR